MLRKVKDVPEEVYLDFLEEVPLRIPAEALSFALAYCTQIDYSGRPFLFILSNALICRVLVEGADAEQIAEVAQVILRMGRTNPGLSFIRLETDVGAAPTVQLRRFRSRVVGLMGWVGTAPDRASGLLRRWRGTFAPLGGTASP